MKLFLSFLAFQLLIFSFFFSISPLVTWVLSFLCTALWYGFYLLLYRFRFGFYCAWFFWEFLKDRLLGGLPWGDLYSFIASCFPLNQVFHWFPPYAVSLFLLGITREGIIGLTRKDKGKIAFAVSLFVIWAGIGYALFVVDKGRNSKNGFFRRSMKVCVFQTGVPLQEKHHVEMGDEIWRDYLEFLRSHVPQRVDLLVFPETMAIYSWPSKDLIVWVERLREEVKNVDVVVLGCNLYSLGSFYNSALLVKPERFAIYSKEKLVPFGEYLPDWFPNWLRAGLGRVVPLLDNAQYKKGSQDIIFKIGDVRLVPLICYEDSFYYLIKDRIKRAGERVDGLLVLSNDEWFGEGLAQWFHLNMARMMAIKFRLWVIKANNDGFSCLIDPFGRVVAGDIHWDNLGKRSLVCGIIKPTTG